MSNINAINSKEIGDSIDEDLVYRKVTWRLIPILFFCYVAAYLDRVNVGFAKLQMLSDLQFSEAVYGFGAGIFFIGYVMFEIPSNLIIRKVGTRVWICRIMITWAIISALVMFVKTPMMFYVLRFLLGVAEAGLFPGLMLYLTYWYPSKRRAKVVALFLAGLPVAGVIGGPLSGYIMHAMAGVNGWAGWQWLFLIEAIPSVVMAIVVLLFIDNKVEDAKWLNPVEKRMLAEAVGRDHQQAQSHSLSEGFTNPRIWLLVIVYFGIQIALYGVSFFLPTFIRNSGATDPLLNGMLSMIPYAVATVAMILVSRSSDSRRERRWHLAIPAIIGALGWLVAVQVEASLTATIIVLSVVTACTLVTVSQFWVLPPSIFSGAAAATGFALINSIGLVAGFLAPLIIGWVIDVTHSTDLGMYMMAVFLTITCLSVLWVKKEWVNR